MRRAAVGVAVCLALVPAGPRAGDAAPDWLEAARARPMHALDGKVPAVVLFEEQMVGVSRSETRSRVREAVKLLSPDAGNSVLLGAVQRIGEDFKLVGGWKVRPDGDVTVYGRQALAQYDADSFNEFSMTKRNVFRPLDARVGDVVAWEYELKSKPEAYTGGWVFGGRHPTILSRFGIRLPEGWSLRSAARNRQESPPSKDDAGYTVWEMRDLPAYRTEPMSPALLDVAPGLLVAYAPPAGAADARVFTDWRSVARWYSGVITPQVTSDEALQRTARELAAKATGPMEAIREVARFVQGVRYLNVAVGRSIAEPHPAPQILKNRFGDCEDKTVLTIALLKEIGVPAYPMLACVKFMGSVAADFPAPDQFNHAIVAIQAPPAAAVSSMIETQALGRLLVFDPTNTSTGLGDLPDYLQGTAAVLAHPDRGDLVVLPVLPPEAGERRAEASVTFAQGGGIDVKATLVHTGQYAANERAYYDSVRGEKRAEYLKSWLGARYARVEVRGIDVKGIEAPDEAVVVTLDLWMQLPGKDLGALRTMAVRPFFDSRARRLDAGERKAPLRIDAGYREVERTVFVLPEGWTLSAAPSAKASSPLGSYRLDSRIEEGSLVVERELAVLAGSVPPHEYAPIRKFFDEVLKGDASSFALERENE